MGTAHPLDRLARVTPAELAGALPDPRIGRQLVQGLIVMSLVDREPSAEETMVVEEFRRALDVSIPR